jgi:predicted nucleic acid-binding Zn ribbon protein
MQTTAEQMAQGMSKAGSGHPMTDKDSDFPKQGERYRCAKCGMEVEVMAECACHEQTEHFRCCGQPMHRV